MRGRQVALWAALVVGPACSSQPVGVTIPAGSTVSVAIAGESGSEGGKVGYGWTADATYSQTDLQRGTLVFDLYSGSTLITSFDPTLITRVYPDPASDAGVNNDLGVGFDIGISQTLAIGVVPSTVSPGPYTLKLRRRDRYGATIAAVPYTQNLTVTSGTGAATSLDAFYPFNSTTIIQQDARPYFGKLYPHPKVILPFTALPKAARIVVGYPTAKIQNIVSVFEEQNLGRGSIVSFVDDPAQGRVTINFADPAGSVGKLAVAFRLKNPPHADNVLPSEFTIQSATLYDGNGSVIAGATVSAPTDIR